MNKTFQNFDEYLYYAYANLQMLHYALKADKPKYDRMCYMIRANAFKAYEEGRWNIHNLFEFNIAKIKQNDYCWYCGKEMERSKLTKDHVFPRRKGGDNDMDNIIMVCKECNWICTFTPHRPAPTTNSPACQVWIIYVLGRLYFAIIVFQFKVCMFE